MRSLRQGNTKGNESGAGELAMPEVRRTKSSHRFHQLGLIIDSTRFVSQLAAIDSRLLFPIRRARGIQMISETANAGHTQFNCPRVFSARANTTGRIAWRSIVSTMLCRGMDSPCSEDDTTRLGMEITQASAIYCTAGWPMSIMVPEALNRRITSSGAISSGSRKGRKKKKESNIAQRMACRIRSGFCAP